MFSLDHKIPPPAVALALVAMMWGLAQPWPRVEVPAPWRIVLTVGIAVAGLAFAGAGTLAFRKAKTTVNPLHPDRASALVHTGVYRITRNPMYLGMALGLLSWAIYLAAPAALLGPVAFVAYITRFQIKPEEQALAARFGSEFAQYKATVRRWI